MDLFRTPVGIPDFPAGIDHNMQLMGMGSCFIEHIGGQLRELKYRWLENPLGIVYNPLSMAGGLQRIMQGIPLSESDLFLHQDVWHSWDFHSRYSHPDRKLARDRMNASIEEAQLFLHKTDWLMLTFGTAFVYRRKENGTVVANCHKVPQTQFDKFLPDPGEFLSAWVALIRDLRILRPDLKLLLTVSPVRHKSDGFIENQRSKARLILLTEELCRRLDGVFYFPAYEIMIDELRDYRFYADDMLHPSEVAIGYIWKRFEENLIGVSGRQLNKNIAFLQQGLSHRPFFPDTEAYRKHLSGLRQKLGQLEALLPDRDWSEEQKLLEANTGLAFGKNNFPGG